MLMASSLGLIGSLIIMAITNNSDIDGFLLIAYLVFVGIWQGMHSQAETIYALNSTDSQLAESARSSKQVWESIGAIVASLISFLFVMYAQPEIAGD